MNRSMKAAVVLGASNQLFVLCRISHNAVYPCGSTTRPNLEVEATPSRRFLLFPFDLTFPISKTFYSRQSHV